MGFKSVMGKELTRVFKDKKLIFSMFILPVVVMVGMFMLIFALVSSMNSSIEKHKSAVYVQNAPERFAGLLSAGEDMNVTYINASEDTGFIMENIKNGDTDLLVVFPEGFEGIVSDESAALPQVKTFYNPSEDNSSEARGRVLAYLEGYRQSLIADKFGSAEAVIMFTVDSDNEESQVYDNDKATGKMLGMFLPYFITMMIFAGAMSLGVDAIAGEKERGTLASLLLTPVSRMEIVMGKMAALGLLSIMSALVYILGMLVAIPVGMGQMGGSEMLSDLSISFTPVQIVQLIVLILGIVIMYVALIGLVSVIAKSVKEAQTYIMPVYMIVIVAGMVSMYTSDTSSFTSYMIPLINSSVAFKGIFTREITAPQFAAAAAVTYATAFVLIALTARAFKSEKIMFNA
ncbi:MAG: ABC transporter permease [Butyrivibrio sp.]|nr:ABC transporter permease [Butyrivibrio sp.]